jgi:LytS/YehU family sensor histidine kinase
MVIDASVALAVPIFRSFFDPHADFPVLLREFLYSVVYANLIGIPISILLPFVWIRSMGLPSPTRLAVRAGLIFTCNFVGCLMAGLVLRGLIGPRYLYWQEFSGSLGLSLVLSAIVVVFVSMYENQEAKVRATALALKNHQLERERVLKLATEARLSSLESRIHPHFLFNTINSVTALIHEDPMRAEKVLGQLAELLRYSLDAAPGGLVTLERELQITGDYLDIEKTRFGGRLEYEIGIPTELLDIPVPPFSLQTLAENSVKYAVGPRGRGALIRIRALKHAGQLSLEVEDDGPGFSSFDLPVGHGLRNLEERLKALFGEETGLRIDSSGSRTAVGFTIPLQNRIRVNDSYAPAVTRM